MHALTAHLNWKLNSAFLISYHHSVHPSVCKLSFDLQSHIAQSILRLREFKFVRMKGHALFQGEIIAIIHWGHLKIFMVTPRPISTKLLGIGDSNWNVITTLVKCPCIIIAFLRLFIAWNCFLCEPCCPLLGNVSLERCGPLLGNFSCERCGPWAFCLKL